MGIGNGPQSTRNVWLIVAGIVSVAIVGAVVANLTVDSPDTELTLARLESEIKKVNPQWDLQLETQSDLSVIIYFHNPE